MKACLFDLDGCLYTGNEAKPESVKGVKRLLSMDVKVGFITNNSTDSPLDIRNKLKGLKFNIHEEPIITPAYYAGSFIKEKFGLSKIFPLGGEVLKNSLLHAGHRIGEKKQPDIVLVSRDINIDFSIIQKAVWFLQKGAFLVATNLDYFHPGSQGMRIVETGAIVSAIEKVIPQKAIVIGKPSTYLYKKALALLETSPGETLMVGDNHSTDILGGRRTGLRTALIESGLSQLDLIMEDYRIQSLQELEELFIPEAQVG
jgi:4-nitrophenyl phosphatase